MSDKGQPNKKEQYASFVKAIGGKNMATKHVDDFIYTVGIPGMKVTNKQPQNILRALFIERGKG